MPTLAVIGFAAGLLHVVNHCNFKGLLSSAPALCSMPHTPST
jgi:hypothetical protein